RVIAIEVFGRARKSGSQLEFIARVEPDEHWLIITLDLVGRLVPETAIKRIAGLAGAAKEIEFRFAPGDADQADELKLFVLLHRAVEELEFPIGPARDVKD